MSTGDTLAYYNETYFHVSGGTLGTGNTLVKYNGLWCHVKNGRFVADNTLVKYKEKLYYVFDGVVDKEYSGDFTFDGKTYTINNGVATLK